MRNIYIDLGCFDGDTIAQFKNWGRLVANNWYIYGFDPNPRFTEQWDKLKDERTFIEPKAAWVYDVDIEFTLRPERSPLGSTVMQNKVDWGMGETMLVPCFDFANFLKQFANDFVIVKMDIEGAEYDVLEHVIAENSDQYIDTIFVEWHDSKLIGKYDKQKIIDDLRCEYFSWG